MKLMISLSKAALFGFCLVLILAGRASGQASGQNWSQLSPTGGPPAATSDFGSALFDPASDRMIIFGGGLNSTPSPPPYDSNAVWVLTNADGLGGTPLWSQLSPTADPTNGLPAPRKGQATAYDSSHNRLILFGGCPLSCGEPLNDVWVLTNANGLGGTPAWAELSPTGGPPARRANHTAVYDPTTNTMIIFGGQNGSTATPPTFSDVWVLSNANGLGGTPVWTELSPTGGPPDGQSSASAVYDSVNNRMIVFGGGLTNGGGVSNAVWMLSNANGQGGSPVWTNLIAEGASGSPDARAGHTAVYDQNSNRMVMFGGENATQTFYNDTWLLTNANGLGGTPTWMQFTPTGGPPAARTLHGAVFNPLSDRMTIFGGTNGTVNLTDAWVLTNANGLINLTPQQIWSEPSLSGGPPAATSIFGSALFDPASDRMIIFGGALNGATAPPYDSNAVWLLTNADGLGGAPQWAQLSPTADPTNGLPAPRKGQATVYDSSHNRLIVFGGCPLSCGAPLNDVWVLTNANGLGGTPAWEELLPTGGPPAGRANHTAVYDPTTNTMIIFGGDNGSSVTAPTFSDVWVLSNANGLGGTPVWTELSPTGGPPDGQYAPSAVYDSVNNRMIVFGGGLTNGGGVSNAVWMLSNANGRGGSPVWTNLIAEGASGSPSAREGHTGVYDQNSNRMVMFGGENATQTFYNDTWLLTNANGLGGTPTWMQFTPNGGPPAARTLHGAVFNPLSDRMTIFGGTNGTANLTDAWVLTNANAVTGPVMGLSTMSLAFQNQLVGSASSPQTITLFDPGNAALTISSIAASGDFAEADTCGAGVAAEGECTISVTFTPTADGPRTGSVTITDDASGSPQGISLSGTGQDFSLAVATGSSSSATVSPGGAATYTLTAASLGGFDQAVTLSCSGGPSEATCSLSQSSVTPSSSGTNVTATVTTTASSVSVPRSRHVPPTRPLTPWPGSMIMLALFLTGVAWAFRHWHQPRISRARTALVALALGLLLTLGMAACGGGGGGGGGGTSNQGTLPGTYTITVTGSFGSGSSALSHSVKLTLTVS